MKKILPLLIVLVLCFSIFTITALAQEKTPINPNSFEPNIPFKKQINSNENLKDNKKIDTKKEVSTKDIISKDALIIKKEISAIKKTKPIVETLYFTFKEPEIYHLDQFDRISIEALDNHGEIGSPSLPVKTVRILIPHNHNVENIEIIRKNKEELEGTYFIEPVPEPKPISDEIIAIPEKENIETTQTVESIKIEEAINNKDFKETENLDSSLTVDKEIYNSNELFPKNLISDVGISEFRGYNILILNLYPVQYVPKTGKIYYLEDIEIEITTSPKPSISISSDEKKEESTFRGLSSDKESVKSMIDNPSSVDDYYEETSDNILSISSDEFTISQINPPIYDYLIITSYSLRGAFQPLADWKTQKGVNTLLVNVEDITDSTFWDDGESSSSEWDLSGFSLIYDNVYRGNPKLPQNFTHSSYHTYYSGQGNDLYNYMATLNSIYISSWSDPVLSFWTRYAIEPKDNVTIQVYNGSQVDILGTFTGNSTGKSSSWIYKTYNLSTYKGQWIDFAFVYETDSSGAEEGFYVDDISINNGVDIQEQIRDFIKLIYENYGINYVLLGGDNEIIPYRGVYGSPYFGEFDIPADLYYGALDGNWDADGDRIYGEPSYWSTQDEADWYAEVYVGRAPVKTYSETQTFVNKVLTYEKNPPTDYESKVLFLGSYLNETGEEKGSTVKETIFNESIPQHITVTKLYSELENLNPQSAINSINNGYNIINHYGHAWYTSIQTGNYSPYQSIDSTDVDNLTNSPRNSILYSLGCYSASFDYNDSIAEHFVLNPNGGALAYIGNSRWGWRGTSDKFDRKFFDALFDKNIYDLGHTLQYAKERYASSSASFEPYRWISYDLNLLGDPEMPIWTDTPQQFTTVTHSLEIPQGTQSFTVSVEKDGSPVEDARVTLWKKGEIYNSTLTYFNGNAYFTINPETLGNISITITKHNFLPYEANISVLPRATILLVDDGYYYILEQDYENALSSKNYAYDMWRTNNNLDSPDIETLLNHSIVVWYTGNDWQNTLTSTDQTNLQTYLDSGGSLFISGQDIGFDLVESWWTINSKAFYNNYLRAIYLFDDTNDNDITGIANDPISDGIVLNLSGGNNNFPSAISPNGSTATFYYANNNTVAGIRYNDTYKLVYLAFPFESINSGALQSELMGKIISWLDSLPPTITNITLTNTLEYGANQTISIVAYDLDEVSSVLINYNGINDTMQHQNNDTWNYTIILPVVGSYNITFYANDSDGAWNSAQSNFIVQDTTSPTITASYSSSITDGSNLLVTANVTDANNVSAVWFEYNSVILNDTNVTDEIYQWNIISPSVGSHSFIIYANDSFDNLANETFPFTVNSAPSPPADTGSAGGGGGGGGGGAGAGSSTASKLFAEITPEGITFAPNVPELSINELFIATKTTAVNIRLGIEKASTEQIPIAAPPEVYKYLQITAKDLPNDNIASARIDFQVDNEWLNDYDADSIAMYRYYDGTWWKLPTSKTNSDGEYNYYSSETSGFSYFAIVAPEIKSITTATETSAEQSETSPITGAAIGVLSGAGKYSLLALALLAAILVIGYVILKRRKPKRKAK